MNHKRPNRKPGLLYADSELQQPQLKLQMFPNDEI